MSYDPPPNRPSPGGYPPPFAPPPLPKPVKKPLLQRPWVLAVSAVLILLIGIGIGSAASSGNSGSKNASASGKRSTPSAPATTESTSKVAAPTTPAGPPKLHLYDFKIKLRIRSSSCFGSAGCNVTYQINPQYLGVDDLSGHKWDITYAVNGVEDGPQINTFTISGNTAHFDSEEIASTTSSDYKLTAKVVSIENDY